MLAEQRMEAIVRMVEEEKSVTVQSLMERLEISESTVRRDLNILGGRGLLVKVHGGAVALGSAGLTADFDVQVREDINREEKRKAAALAASLIRPNDFVYLDAGTTTGYLIDCLTERQVTFVTNGVMHARKLAGKGYSVYLPGGQLKPVTEALVGEETVENISRYHFTKGFFGANGVDIREGFTTPDVRESRIKARAMRQCAKRFVVCDSSKLSKISSVTFAEFESAVVIVSGKLEDRYRECRNVLAADAKC